MALNGSGFGAMLARVCIGVAVLSLSAVLSAAAGERQPVPSGWNDAPGVSASAVDDAIRKVKPSLVRILVVSVDHVNGREVKYRSAGSGVIISEDGYVVTNHHVAGHARQIVCTLSNREEVPAVLVGTDPLVDIAVIKLAGDAGRTYPAAKFGDSSLLQVGERVLAMGSPLAFSQSVTMGIVSNTEVVMPKMILSRDRFLLEGEDVGSVVRWIGHDARIFGGNSGGPLVNLDGEIVGINEINIGISGAIPGNQARDVAEEIIRSGRIERSWFGLEFQPLLTHAKQAEGALVSGVIEGSPADTAGFKPGDILLAVGGENINVRFAEEVPLLNKMMMEVPVGETLDASVLRDGKQLVLHMTSSEREYVRPGVAELYKWGITARDISLMDSMEMRRDSRDGVLVTGVRPGGPCRDAKPEIAPGDVIVLVDDVAVKDIEGLIKLTGEKTRGRKEAVPVLVTFDRDKERFLTVVGLRNRNEHEKQGVLARKAWLPVSTQVLTRDIAEGLGHAGFTGMRVTRVYPGTNAEKAGLMVGDVITSLNGEAVTPYSDNDVEYLEEMVRQYRIGSEVELGILRGGETLKLGIVLAETPRSPKDLAKYTDDRFEFTVRDISFLDEVELGNGGDVEGVLVESVNEGGWASVAMLSIDDLIMEVDGSPVNNAKSFEAQMERVAAERPKSVVFWVKRGIHTLFIEMEPTWPDEDLS